MRGSVPVLTLVLPNPLKSGTKNLSNFTFSSYRTLSFSCLSQYKIMMMTILLPTPSTEPPVRGSPRGTPRKERPTIVLSMVE